MEWGLAYTVGEDDRLGLSYTFHKDETWGLKHRLYFLMK
jgi:hypothetical protein